jgi:hypothetical protein
MIRIERGKEISPECFSYSLVGLEISGKSRQPLLEVCRQLLTKNIPPTERVGIFREGKNEPDLACTVGAGAKLVVVERNKGGIRFEKFEEVNWAAFKEAAE